MAALCDRMAYASSVLLSLPSEVHMATAVRLK
jgi:hypothetical protein